MAEVRDVKAPVLRNAVVARRPFRRIVAAMHRDLGRLEAETFDVLVVGGGIHGAFAAYDAAGRGLRTALVEAADFGSGASWNSMKTVHGGLRYLQRLDLPRMRESIRERRTLLRIAPPGLVVPLGFVVPTYGHGMTGREAMAMAGLASDAIAFDRNHGLNPALHLPRSRSLSVVEVRALVPGAPTRALTGGFEWHDAQVQSTERLLLSVLHAAAAAGAALATRLAVTSVEPTGARHRVTVTDREGGGTLVIDAGTVLLAAGSGTPALFQACGIPRPPLPLLRGWNFVLRRSAPGELGIGMRAAGRFLFLVPWAGRALIGTGYEPAGKSTGMLALRAFRAECATAFPWLDLRDEDVALVHEGHVPGGDGAASLIERSAVTDHAGEGRPGLVSVQGIKYTTARGVAAHAVDLVARHLQKQTRSRSADVALPTMSLPASLDAATRQMIAEEMALHLDDVVLRRLDLGTGGLPPQVQVDQVAGTMAAVLGWDDARTARERAALAARYPHPGDPFA